MINFNPNCLPGIEDPPYCHPHLLMFRWCRPALRTSFPERTIRKIRSNREGGREGERERERGRKRERVRGGEREKEV